MPSPLSRAYILVSSPVLPWSPAACTRPAVNDLSLNRRAFLGTSAAALAAGVHTVSAQAPRRKKIALIGTEVRRHSHAQHFIDRFLLGYAWESGWRRPDVDLVSLYIDQFPSGDLARATAARFDVPIYGGIAEALTLGGSELAVDGVVIIGEHGDYPTNELGQKLYPRYKFFKEVVQVFEASGRSVPVFNDKHLSTDWDECVEMVEDGRRLDFAFLAGSSLPVTWRLPSIDLPLGSPLRESVCVAYGGMDSYDFHGLETAQCMSERRRGGEVGVRSVHAFRDENMWQALAERPDTRRLFESALQKSHNLPEVGGSPTDKPTFDWARKTFASGFSYFIEHNDGLRTSLFMLPISDFNYAGLLEDDQILACQMYLPMPGRGATTADFFNPLVRHIEDLIVNEQAPYPVERTLLTSGMTMAGVRSLHQGERLVETPEMAVQYAAPEQSLFWGANA